MKHIFKRVIATTMAAFLMFTSMPSVSYATELPLDEEKEIAVTTESSEDAADVESSFAPEEDVEEPVEEPAKESTEASSEASSEAIVDDDSSFAEEEPAAEPAEEPIAEEVDEAIITTAGNKTIQLICEYTVKAHISTEEGSGAVQEGDIYRLSNDGSFTLVIDNYDSNIFTYNCRIEYADDITQEPKHYLDISQTSSLVLPSAPNGYGAEPADGRYNVYITTSRKKCSVVFNTSNGYGNDVKIKSVTIGNKTLEFTQDTTEVVFNDIYCGLDLEVSAVTTEPGYFAVFKIGEEETKTVDNKYHIDGSKVMAGLTVNVYSNDADFYVDYDLKYNFLTGIYENSYGNYYFTGETVTFTASPNDVHKEIKSLTYKIYNRFPVELTPDENGVYTIPEEVVNAQYSADVDGSYDGCIMTGYVELEATIETRNDLVNVTFKVTQGSYFEYLEFYEASSLIDYSSGKALYHDSISSSDLVNGSVTIPAIKGNIIIFSGIKTSFKEETNQVNLYRINQIDSTGNAQQLNEEPRMNGAIYTDSISGDINLTFETARLRKDDVKFVVTGENEKVKLEKTYNGYFNDYTNVDSVDYLSTDFYLSSRYNYGYNFFLNDTDTINSYELTDVTYTVYGGSKTAASLMNNNYNETYMILPYSVLRDAAFSTPQSGSCKLTINAAIVQKGYKTQYILTASTDTVNKNDFEIRQNGVPVSSEYFYDDTYMGYINRRDIGYKSELTVTVDAKGVENLKIYVIKRSAYEEVYEAVTGDTSIKDDEKGKEIIKSLVANNEGHPGNSYTFKADDNYVIFATGDPSYQIYMIGPDSMDQIPDDTTFNVYSTNNRRLNVVSSDESQQFPEKGSIIITDITDPTNLKNVNFDDVFEFSSRNYYLELLDNPNNIGKTFNVTITFSAELIKTFNLKYVPPIAKGDVSFVQKELEKDDVTGDNCLKITLGSSRKFHIDFKKEISADDFYLRLKDDNKGMVLTKKSAKEYLLTAPVNRNSYPGSRSDYVEIIDSKSETVIDSVSIYCDTSAIANADMSGVKVTPYADSIAFDFSQVKVNKTVEGQYFYVYINYTGSSEDFPEYYSRDAYAMYPISQTSFTVTLVNHSYLVEREVPYQVRCALLQAYDNDTSSVLAGSQTPLVKDVALGGNILYPNKLKITKVNSAPKKLYTKMGIIKFATVSYPDVAKNTPPTVQQLKNVEIYDKDGNAYSGGIDFDGNEIYINTSYLSAGKYKIVAYTVAPKGKSVSATLNVDILQGIDNILCEAPAMIFKTTGKKATVKANVYYNFPNSVSTLSTIKKAANPKFEWSLVEEHYDIPYTYPGVSIKNGTITIDAKTVIPSDGISFRVKVTAADHERGNTPRVDYHISDAITVTGQVITPSAIRINGKKVTSKSELISTDIIPNNSSYNPINQIQVLDENGSIMNNVDLTISGVAVSDKMGTSEGIKTYIKSVTKPGTITIKATTDDGSKKSYSVKFKVVSDDSLTAELLDWYILTNNMIGPSQSPDIGILTSPGQQNIYNKGSTLLLAVASNNNALVNHSVNVSGGKIALKGQEINEMVGAPSSFSCYYIIPTAQKTTVTITQKQGNKKYVFDLTNSYITGDKKAKAVKVKASNSYDVSKGKTKDNAGKIFYHMDYRNNSNNRVLSNEEAMQAYTDAGAYNDVTYTVLDSSNKPLPAGQKVAVELLFDYNKASKDSSLSFSNKAIMNCFEGSGLIQKNNTTYIATLDDTGSFKVRYMLSNGTFNVINKFKLGVTVTPLNDKGEATAKPGKTTIQAIAPPKAKVSLKNTTFVLEKNSLIAFGKTENIAFIADRAQAYLGDEFSAFLAGSNVNGKITKVNNDYFAFVQNSVTGEVSMIFSGTLNQVAEVFTIKNNVGTAEGYMNYKYQNLDGTWSYASSKIKIIKNNAIPAK